MKMKTADLGASILLLLLCAAGSIETGKFTQQAALLPRITFFCIAALSVLQLAKLLWRPSQKNVPFQWKRIFSIIGLAIFYVLLIPILGYWISTLLFIFASMAAFGVHSKIALVCIPAGFALFVYMVFVRVLSLSPPAPFFMQ